jgi:Armadillo/beta-catenin-like repeat
MQIHLVLLDGNVFFSQHVIKRAGGVLALVKLLKATQDGDVHSLVTGILWNLSSCPVSYIIYFSVVVCSFVVRLAFHRLKMHHLSPSELTLAELGFELH